MTKMEMVNRMIILGCIKEKDRNRWMRHSKEYITNIYIEIVPIRLAHLNKQKGEYTMTIKELYEWAKEKGYENFNIYDTSEEQIDVYEEEKMIDFIPHWAID